MLVLHTKYHVSYVAMRYLKPENFHGSEPFTRAGSKVKPKLYTPKPRHNKELRLMDKILHYFKYPKLWELWYMPYNG